MKPAYVAAAILLGLAAPLPIATSALAQTSFSKSANPAPTNSNEWRDALQRALMNSLRRADSSLAMQGSTAGIAAALSVTVARAGQITDVRIAQSSGRPSLDAALVRAAARTKQVAPFTSDMGGDAVTLTLGLGVEQN